jgi:hypothetical protein
MGTAAKRGWVGSILEGAADLKMVEAMRIDAFVKWDPIETGQ